MDKPDLLSFPQAVTDWPVNKWKLRRMVQRREIPHFRIRNRVYFEPDAWERYLAAHRVEARSGEGGGGGALAS